MKEIKETILITIMSLMFWGVLYPEFSLTPQTYCLSTGEEKNPEKDFFEILNAPSGKIKVKSRLWEWIIEERR
ncbi:MAG: hypothetical protein IKW28_00810 [Lachnospiraceae bacterium]|nr:hypothetical protein [Lachnospiraceae bacterium]